MRELLVSLLLASCLVPVGIGGVKISSSLAEEKGLHRFADVGSEPLWSSEVKRVDPQQQIYARLPAVHIVDQMVATTQPPARVSVILGATGRPFNDAGEEGSVIHTALVGSQVAQVQEWCGARYRSYDPADNSYQPYGSGPRRACAVPEEVTASRRVETVDPGAMAVPDANARWCMERYASYRVEDNSYQPFSGDRKQCLGPASHTATNTARAGDPSFVQF